MEREVMEQLLKEIDENPNTFDVGELGFLQGLVEGYAGVCRRALKDKRKILGVRIQDVENRLKVADAMYNKLAQLIALTA